MLSNCSSYSYITFFFFNCFIFFYRRVGIWYFIFKNNSNKFKKCCTRISRMAEQSDADFYQKRANKLVITGQWETTVEMLWLNPVVPLPSQKLILRITQNKKQLIDTIYHMQDLLSNADLHQKRVNKFVAKETTCEMKLWWRGHTEACSWLLMKKLTISLCIWP